MRDQDAAARSTAGSIPIGAIDPDPDNIRAGTGDVTELAESIARTGLMNPLTVYPTGPDRWRLSAGHRRYAALRLLGRDEVLVPDECKIVDPPASDLDRLDRMIAENLHREQLNPMEEARAFRRYADADLNQEQIAQRVGRPQSHVSTTLMFLTELTDDEQQQLESGQLTRAAAVGLIKSRRAEQGRARADAGAKHRYGYSVPWFNRHHPQASAAQQRCRDLDHSPALRIGPACGPCWEHVITTTARTRGPATPPLVLPPAALPPPPPAAAPPEPPPPPRPAPVPPPAPAAAKFGDAHRPSRADDTPALPPVPRPDPAPLSAGTRRDCGCTIPPEISDAIVARNARVHEPGCRVADDIDLDRMTGRHSR